MKTTVKYYLLIGLFLVHVAFLISNSLNNTVTTYFDFYQVKNKDKGVNKILNAYTTAFSSLASKTPVAVYARYSGAEMGYGFFAPNVLSSGDMVFEYKGRRIAPHISSYEGSVRFGALISRFVGHLVKPSCQKDTSRIDPRLLDIVKGIGIERSYQFEDQYFELVLKNVAAKVYADHSCRDTLKVRLMLYSYPSLRDFNSPEKKMLTENYQCIKQNTVFLR